MNKTCNSQILFKDKFYSCAFEITIDLIGGKWKSLIIWHLGTKGILRFSQIKRLMPNITQKMLTQQLRELEENHLIIRKVYAVVPPKVEYSLSETGKQLIPILNQLCDWGKEYHNTFQE